MANALNRDIVKGEVVLLDPSTMAPYLTEAQLLLRCDMDGFGYKAVLRGTAVMGHWVDGTEPWGIRIEGPSILCSCRPETWQCPGCGKFQQVFWKNTDGRRCDAETEELVAGQACGCGKEFDESSWTCASPIEG